MAGADPGRGIDIGGQVNVMRAPGRSPDARMDFKKRLAVPW